MRQTVLLVFTLIAFNNLFAQKCNCTEELKFIENNLEQNLPAYQDQVIAKRREAAYIRHKTECNAIAAKLTNDQECTYLLAKYISFFRDEHLRVNFKDDYFPFSSLADTSKVRAFFKKEQIYAFPPAGKNIRDGICGYWQSKDKNYIVQIISHKTVLTDYIGVIVNADPQYWTPGQLKFGLKRTGSNSFESLYLVGSRQPREYKAVVNGSELTIGRMNIFYKLKDTFSVHEKQNDFVLGDRLEFKELSAKTNYLRIPSFATDQYKAIDSIIAANLKSILSKPGLIIDVRNNGGGNDRSYQALLPLVLDKKVSVSPITFTIFATPLILKYFTDTRYENCDNKEDSVSSDSSIAIMERNIGRFTPKTVDTTTLDTIYNTPRKVAILANRWCASTTEGFIVKASESKKTKLYGENTGGVISYGEWMKLNLPCLPVWLSMPTEKTFISNYSDLESTGIPPKVKLDHAHEEDWIMQVQKDIEK